MSARLRTRDLALLVAVALVSAPARPAYAEDPVSSEGEVMAPEPEADSKALAADPTVEPLIPPETQETPITAEPIEPVHRPKGFWGPVAVAADLLVMRPIGFLSLAGAGAAFVVVSPVAAATQTLGDRTDALADRARNVFTRPLGAL